MPPFGYENNHHFHLDEVPLRSVPLNEDEENEVLAPTLAAADVHPIQDNSISGAATSSIERKNDTDYHHGDFSSVMDFANDTVFDHMNILNQSLMSSSSVDSDIFSRIQPTSQIEGLHNQSGNSVDDMCKKLLASANAVTQCSPHTKPPMKSAMKKTSSDSKKTKIRKYNVLQKVTFDSVHVREHYVIVGDHPFCRCGPPLSLGWEHNDCPIVSIDQFEYSPRKRRNRSQLRLNPCEREAMLFPPKKNYIEEDSAVVSKSAESVNGEVTSELTAGFFFLPREVFKSMAKTARE